MNALSYQCTEENGLSFVLLVDGEPLGQVIGSMDRAIPYYLFSSQNDLPRDARYSGEADEDVRIVAVCSCGEYECGSTPCRVVHNGETVIFRDFYPALNVEGFDREFRFTRATYEAVVAGMVARASAYRTGAPPPGDYSSSVATPSGTGNLNRIVEQDIAHQLAPGDTAPVAVPPARKAPHAVPPLPRRPARMPLPYSSADRCVRPGRSARFHR
jgi:hypothetical protein